MDAEELLRRYAAGERDFPGVDLSGAVLEGTDLRVKPVRSTSDLASFSLIVSQSAIEIAL